MKLSNIPYGIPGDYYLTINDCIKSNSPILKQFLTITYAFCQLCKSRNFFSRQILLEPFFYVKFYFYGNGQPHLRAANPSYLDIDYRDGYSCAGYMVALLRKDAPPYQAYKKYLAVNDSEEWMEVIALAGAAGLNTNQVKEILKGQIEIAKRLKGG